MIWSIETDDFLGKCGQGKFPLLVSIRKGLNNQVVENPPEGSTQTTSTTTQQPSSSTTTPASSTYWTQWTPSTTQTSQQTSSSTTVDPFSSTSTSTTTSSPGQTTTQNPDVFVCKEEGVFKGFDCATFYQCVFVGEFGKDGSKYRLFTFHCPSGKLYILFVKASKMFDLTLFIYLNLKIQVPYLIRRLCFASGHRRSKVASTSTKADRLQQTTFKLDLIHPPPFLIYV